MYINMIFASELRSTILIIAWIPVIQLAGGDVLAEKRPDELFSGKQELY